MINNVVLVGRLVKDMDLKYTGQGTPVGTFTLAVNKPFTNKEGNREADFINCVIWRKSAENMANMAKKGALVGIAGRIQTRNYENKQGQRVYVTEVIADNFQLLESKASSENRTNNVGAGNGYNNGQANNYGNQQQGFNRDPFGGSNTIDVSDDDLPF